MLLTQSKPITVASLCISPLVKRVRCDLGILFIGQPKFVCQHTFATACCQPTCTQDPLPTHLYPGSVATLGTSSLVNRKMRGLGIRVLPLMLCLQGSSSEAMNQRMSCLGKGLLSRLKCSACREALRKQWNKG
eukprot:1157315-Pelagomonas_calceolata.AAC.4